MGEVHLRLGHPVRRRPVRMGIRVHGEGESRCLLTSRRRSGAPHDRDPRRIERLAVPEHAPVAMAMGARVSVRVHDLGGRTGTGTIRRRPLVARVDGGPTGGGRGLCGRLGPPPTPLGPLAIARLKISPRPRATEGRTPLPLLHSRAAGTLRVLPRGRTDASMRAPADAARFD